FGAQTFATNRDHVAGATFTGGRITALLQATDALKFTMTYLTQKTEIDGQQGTNRTGYTQAILGVPEQYGSNDGGTDTRIHLANAVMDYNLGWGSVLATYSYTTSGSQFSVPWAPNIAPFPVVSPEVGDHREQNAEVRLVTRLSGAWNFLAGLYAEKLNDV